MASYIPSSFSTKGRTRVSEQSQSGLRKLGVMMEKRMSGGFDSARVRPGRQAGRNDRGSSGPVRVDAASFARLLVAFRIGHSAPAAVSLRGFFRFEEGGI